MPTGRMNVWQIRRAEGMGNRRRLFVTVLAALAVAVPIMAGGSGEAAPAAANQPDLVPSERMGPPPAR
jgi:hypothetical protein